MRHLRDTIYGSRALILPGKHLTHDRALLGVGAEVLTLLSEERTISELWERLKDRKTLVDSTISFDWFVLSLSFLYATRAIKFDGLFISRATQ